MNKYTLFVIGLFVSLVSSLSVAMEDRAASALLASSNALAQQSIQLSAQISAQQPEQPDVKMQSETAAAQDADVMVGKYKRSELIRLIEQDKFDLNEKFPDANGDEENILLHAVRCDHFEMAKLVIRKGFTDFFVQNSAGHNPLHIAALCCNISMMQILLPHIPVNSQDSMGYTALNHAVDANQLESCGFLIGQADADVNMPTFNLITPLMSSTTTNNPAITELLLKNGADASYKNSDGHDAYFLASNALHGEKLATTDHIPKEAYEKVSLDNDAIIKLLNPIKDQEQPEEKMKTNVQVPQDLGFLKQQSEQAYASLLKEENKKIKEKAKKNRRKARVKLKKASNINTGGSLHEYYNLEEDFKQRKKLSIAALKKLKEKYRIIHTTLKNVSYTGWETKRAYMRYGTLVEDLRPKNKQKKQVCTFYLKLSKRYSY